MKKTFLPAVFAFLLSSVGAAQPLRSIGVKLAYTSSDQVFDYSAFSAGRVRRPGVNAGVFAEWFSGPVALITQLEYAQRGFGATLEITGPSSPEVIRVETQYSRVDYLSIPLLAKVYLLREPFRPYLLAGGRLDIMLGYESYKHLFDSVYQGFSKTTYGITVGAGLETVFLPLMVEVRYNFDLKDSYKTTFLTVSNNSIDFWLGIALNVVE